jgi:curved DNA-binding protein CbpA
MDPYRELGVDRAASEADIKTAYRKLALQCHPDRHLNSSPAEAAAAAHRFKAITEAYDFLTNPNERMRSSYGASSSAARGGSSSSSSRAYHYNVNTDWSHYETGSTGYTSTISRWEWWKRAARHGARSFGHSLHISLAVMLVGGAVMFEYSHSALWAARNKGKSFEEVQAAVRARRQAAAGTSSSSNSSSSDPSAQAGAATTQQQQQQDQVYLLRSSWADGMRGRFVTEQPGDPSVPADAGSTEPTTAADPAQPSTAAS